MSTTLELEPTGADDELTEIARAAMWDLWGQASGRRQFHLRRRRDYANGRSGIPDIDSDATEELRDLAKISRLNMCGVVRDTFARGLSCVGFRSPQSQDDEPAWLWWQKHRLDARQHQIHSHALTYGEGFVSVLPDDRTNDKARPVIWSPLSAVVDYDEPGDLFPTRAMLIRHTAEGYSVLMVDDMTVTPGILRKAKKSVAGRKVDGVRWSDVEVTGESWEHGGAHEGRPVCPVVRFVDRSSDEGEPSDGVVEPVIELNRAMNQVNFDRLVVARFGAHDQKLIIGWTAPTDRLAKLSAAHIGAIDEHPNDVRVDRWQGSPLAPYNELVKELREQVALEASIPLWAAGSISNVSTDTAAMIEAAHQRELAAKRESYGESWEQVIRLAMAMSGETEPDPGAEMVWRETQARAFGAVVDGITKLASIPADSSGVPVTELLDLIPGMSQQRIQAIKQAMKRPRADAILQRALGQSRDAAPPQE